MRPRLFLFCATTALLASCRDEKIATYRVPKDAPSPAVPASANAATSDIAWILPAGWTAQPDQSGMRKGSFLVSGADGAKADMSVTAFPGDVGGDLANVNRWRGQVGLAPIDDAALAQTVQTIDAPAGKFSFIELSGESTAGGAQQPVRMVGAWLQQPDRRWFFKLVGDDALVTAQHDAFMSFLNSVSFAAAPAVAGSAKAQSTNDLPKAPFAPFTGGATTDAGASYLAPAPADSAAPDVAPQATLTWTAPADWQAKPLGAMRLGSFTVSGDGGDADVSIIAFPGEAGGLLANINRWRGQLGLAPLAEGDLASATTAFDGTGGLHFTVVDLTGQTAGAPARMLGAVLSFGGQTYFFKLTGPDALVAREKPAFLDFLKTVKAPLTMHELLQPFVRFFVSLRLTVVLLVLSILLVFLATLDQVHLGVWGIQHKWFFTFIVVQPVNGFPVPVFPGGYFIGGMLLINLIAAHVYRFKFTWKKSGHLARAHRSDPADRQPVFHRP